MSKTILSLGSNMGNKGMNLSLAIRSIENGAGKVIGKSLVYETGAWGFDCNDNFFNQVVMIETDLSPRSLMDFCLETERRLGRERKLKGQYESRLIDIDILFYSDLVINDEDLKIPHPLLHQRRFVLEPLCEIVPLMVHPVLGITITELLRQCPDNGLVKKAKS